MRRGPRVGAVARCPRSKHRKKDSRDHAAPAAAAGPLLVRRRRAMRAMVLLIFEDAVGVLVVAEVLPEAADLCGNRNFTARSC